MLSPVVSLHPYFFLRALLLLAGDVEANPGPIQGKEIQYHAGQYCCAELYEVNFVDYRLSLLFAVPIFMGAGSLISYLWAII